MREAVFHNGIIERMDGNHVFVRIGQLSECSECVIRKCCTIAETDNEIVEVTADDTSELAIGKAVIVIGEESPGLHATRWALGIPLLILLVALILLGMITKDEIISSIGAVLLLIPYYYILWKKKDKFKQHFKLTLKYDSEKEKKL